VVRRMEPLARAACGGDKRVCGRSSSAVDAMPGVVAHVCVVEGEGVVLERGLGVEFVRRLRALALILLVR